MGSDIFPDVALARAAHHPPQIMTRSHFNDGGDYGDEVIMVMVRIANYSQVQGLARSQLLVLPAGP